MTDKKTGDRIELEIENGNYDSIPDKVKFKVSSKSRLVYFLVGYGLGIITVLIIYGIG